MFLIYLIFTAILGSNFARVRLKHFSSCLDEHRICSNRFLKIFVDINEQELTAVKTKKRKISWNLEKGIRQLCFADKTVLILERFEMHDSTFNGLISIK